MRISVVFLALLVGCNPPAEPVVDGAPDAPIAASQESEPVITPVISPIFQFLDSAPYRGGHQILTSTWTIDIRYTVQPDEELYARLFETGGHQGQGGGVSVELWAGDSNDSVSCILWGHDQQITYRVDALMPQVGIPTDFRCSFDGTSLSLSINGGLEDRISANYVPAVQLGFGVGMSAHADLDKALKGPVSVLLYDQAL